MPFIQDEDLPEDLFRGPISPQGTYTEMAGGNHEDIANYRPGGYHPVHIGDLIGELNRYRVVHKLGHGARCTVWLCRDRRGSRYVAVKIMVSSIQREDMIDLRLADLDLSVLGAMFCAIPLDNFAVTGPNGTHQCLVLPVLGPSIADGFWVRLRDPAATLRSMIRQGTHALNFLHRNHICHGDLRSENILVRLADFNSLSEPELIGRIAVPVPIRVRAATGPLPASTPRYVLAPCHIRGLCRSYMMDDICLIGYGSAYHTSSPPPAPSAPPANLPPEAILRQPNSMGESCDIWAWGCTIFTIRLQTPIHPKTYNDDEILGETMRVMGRFPDELYNKWEERSSFFDPDGEWYISSKEKLDCSIEDKLAHSRRYCPVRRYHNHGHPRPSRSLSVPGPERYLLGDLLHKIFVYDAKQRISARDILDHEWFKA
ncbi:kinase-like domain-containing protein [Stachybotrys elegans]|uniref:EKC/KEOPS complex subunit BUD32 n=1 Tax=Stachybotrys elegans TaxID=80388 RepID=A0A8K0WLR5_9HYPO|nr:kinase-like domain-containing protein [Stachybotrys elegans]